MNFKLYNLFIILLINLHKHYKTMAIIYILWYRSECYEKARKRIFICKWGWRSLRHLGSMCLENIAFDKHGYIINFHFVPRITKARRNDVQNNVNISEQSSVHFVGELKKRLESKRILLIHIDNRFIRSALVLYNWSC